MAKRKRKIKLFVKYDRKQLIKDCLDIWKKIVITKAGGKCEYCGKKAQVAHHIVTTKNMSTKFAIENGCALCNGHHGFFAHIYYEKFRKFIIGRRGCEWHEKLMWKANTTLKYTTSDLVLLKQALEIELKELKDGQIPPR